MPTGLTKDFIFEGTDDKAGSPFYQKYNVKFHVVETYDIAANTSTFSITVYVNALYGYYSSQYFLAKVSVNGTVIVNTRNDNFRYSTGGNDGKYVQLYDNTLNKNADPFVVTVPHNSDGSLTLTIKLDDIRIVDHNGTWYYYYNGDLSGKSSSQTFTTIPRGIANIWVNSAWKKYLTYIYTSSGWKQYIPYIYTSSGWTQYGA